MDRAALDTRAGDQSTNSQAACDVKYDATTMRVTDIVRRPGGHAASPWARAAIVAGLALAVSWLHYAASPGALLLHEVYQYFYYVPLVLGAYWGGVPGGVGAAVLISFLFVPHVVAMGHSNPSYSLSMYAHVIAFNLLGLSVGLAMSAQRRLADRERATASSLQRANQDLRNSHEHLRRADRLAALGEIAAGLAHEIKNPLVGVKGALEIIQSRVRPDTPEGEFAALGGRELRRLEQLVGDFLAYARPRPPERTSLDVRSLCEQVCELLRVEADRAQVVLNTVAEATDPNVLADRAMIEQVLVNVTLNAIHASPPHGVVILGVRADSANVCVSVEDTGPGVSADIAARMFEPFFTTKEGGTGLGLAISQRIVAAHDGVIHAEERPSGGTRVVIRLPRALHSSTSTGTGPEQHASA